MPTSAERVISATRTVVWAAIDTDDEPDTGWCQKLVGAPESGVGARHLHVGPPQPPYGMRTVMYTELTALLEGFSYTTETSAGTWAHTETLQLEDTAEGATLARITGLWVRPAPPSANFTEVQTGLNGLAASALERLARRAESGSA